MHIYNIVVAHRFLCFTTADAKKKRRKTKVERPPGEPVT